MKRYASLVTMLVLVICCSMAQTIAITFEGTLNGTAVPLDSIRVMNLTAGGDTMIFFPGNVLVLGSIGVDELMAQAPVLRNLPNPFAGFTDILVGTRRTGHVVLQVHDATGREEVSFAGSIAAGQHRFRFTAATPGVHVLTVIQGGQRASCRLVSMDGEASGTSLVHTGGTGAVEDAKSDRSLFSWTPGDELRYIGYATDDGIVHSTAIDEVPMISATRTFTLLAGRVCPESPRVTDIDGNLYRAVQIGEQCWMAENLKTGRGNNGSSIPNVTGITDWTQLNSGAWCNYDNDPANDTVHGKLYNWYAAADPAICPIGWHVPTDAEWQQLEQSLGMLGGELNSSGTRGAAQNVGRKMKATTLWNATNTGGTNETGFVGLPGGFLNPFQGYFGGLGNFGYWWSVSETAVGSIWNRGLQSISAGVIRDNRDRRMGFCVRCVRD